MKIYVHGNCQAPALADLLAEAGGGAIDAVNRQVYSLDLKRDMEGYLRDIATADVILTQPVADGYRSTEVLSTSWIRANAKPDAVVLVFPVIYHRGQLPQCFTLGDYHDGRLAYHDAHALDFFLRGESVADFTRATSRSDFLPHSFVEGELARTTLELLRREHSAGVDISVSDMIASRLSTGQPLYTINHPSRALMVELADRILRRLGRPERARLEGTDMLDRFVMPPYISAALALDHNGAALNLDEVRVDGVYEARQSFYEAVFESYRQIGRQALRAAVGTNPEIGAYLERFRAAAAATAEPRDMGPLVTALYDVFFNRPARTDEILYHLQAVRRLGFGGMVSAFPGSSEFFANGGADAMVARFTPVEEVPQVAVLSEGGHHSVRGMAAVRRPEMSTSLMSRLKAVYKAFAKGVDDLPDQAALSSEVPEDMLTIVVPMAGLGSRFSNAGYTLPKPLILVGDEPMIKVVIDNLRPARPHRFVFICQVEHDLEYGLTEKLATWAPGSAVVLIDGVTEGAACTVLAAQDCIGSGPLMIANSDQFVDVDINDYLAGLRPGVDGLIMTMRADDPKWSYAGLTEDGWVSRVVEKEVISEEATVGIYNFASGLDFVRAAEAMIAADLRVNGEFYVAPVYNQLIGEGSRISVFNVGSEADGMHGLGTPDDLNRFLALRPAQGLRGAA